MAVHVFLKGSYITSASLTTDSLPSSKIRETGETHVGRFLEQGHQLAVPSAVNSVAVTACISARRLKRSAKRKMYEFLLAVTAMGPK